MQTYIHPSILLIPPSSPFRKNLEGIASLFVNSHKDLFQVADFSISVKDINQFKPTGLRITELKQKGVVVEHPFIVSFIDLSSRDLNDYFVFLNQVQTNLPKDNEYSDFRFLNIIIRDLSRDNASDWGKTSFYQQFEQFCRDNMSNPNISLSYFYNLIIDGFNEKDGIKFGSNEIVLKHLAEQLRLILVSSSKDKLELQNCKAVTKNADSSPVRYNSIGFAKVGFNQARVTKCISLKRKINFLDEILSVQSLSDDNALKITRETQDFYNKEFNNIEEEVFKNILDVTFLADLDNYYDKQEHCNRYLVSEDLKDITKSVLNNIDETSISFKTQLKIKEEEAISYAYVKEKRLNTSIEIFITEIFDKYNFENSIIAVIYSLRGLLNSNKQHVITKEEKETIGTLRNKKEELERATPTILPKEDYEKQRQTIKNNIDDLDKKIIAKYRSLKKINKSRSLKWLTKNFVNIILIPCIGFLLSLMIVLANLQTTTSILDNFDWDNRIIISLSPFFISCLVGFFRAYILKEEFNKQTKLLLNLTNEKEKKIHEYSQTYVTYFALIVDKIKIEQSINIINRNISFTNSQIGLIKKFQDTLGNIRQNFIQLYDEFNFDEDFFNISIIGKKEIEYYCKKNKLDFWKNKKVSTYFQTFINSDDFFKPLRYAKVTNDVTENEEIAPANNYDKTMHRYKIIENFNTVTYLSDNEDSNDVIYTDVKQGQVGNCYFMAGLAGIAYKKPQYIKNIIDDSGKYPAIYFYDENLQTHKISIDKKFWVDENDNPIYAKFGTAVDKDREVWTMLIEKGWAKINKKSYNNIVGDTRDGKIRELDYSLALTGIKAIRENLEPSYNIEETKQRIKEHIISKPIVIYSISEKIEQTHTSIRTNHAYTLLNIKEDICEIYNPHGEIINIDLNELHYNFDTVLYFDFNYEEDKHLHGIYSDYFTRLSDKGLLYEFDEIIKEDNLNNILNKSLEETMSSNIFNLMIDDDKKDKLTQQIIDTSTPLVYLCTVPDNNYNIYFLGKNKLLQGNFKTELSKLGLDTDDIATLESSEKRIGILRLRNNLKMNDIIH